jgi:hypothetical protein
VRRVRPGVLGRRLATRAILAAFALHAVVGVLQLVFGAEDPDIGLVGGRARGLTLNPVFFGALMTGGAVCAIACLTRKSARTGWFVALLVLFCTAVNMSGSRAGLGALAVVALWQCATMPRRRGLAVLAVTVASIVGSQLALQASGSERSASTRTAVLEGSDGRSDVWGFGLDATLDAPLFGEGPGRFRAAIQDQYTPGVVRANGGMEAWADAHNIVIQMGATTGVVGLVLFGAFLVLALRRARGPHRAIFVAILLTWMLQPWSLSTAPIAFFALGVAMQDRPEGSPPGRAARRVAAVAVSLGIAASAYYAWADVRLASAFESATSHDIERAAARLPDDAVVAELLAQVAVLEWMTEGTGDERLAALIERPTEIEPDRSRWWVKLAARRLLLGDVDGARAAFVRAESLQEWDYMLWDVALSIAEVDGDAELEARATEHVCAIDPEADICD